jgi:hypothetical protein
LLARADQEEECNQAIKLRSHYTVLFVSSIIYKAEAVVKFTETEDPQIKRIEKTEK